MPIHSLDRAIRAVNRWADDQAPGLGRTLAQTVGLPLRLTGHLWRNRHYLTAPKLLNMALVNAERRLGRRRLRGLPYVIKIEPTNICNSACQLCPTGRNLPGRAKGKMSLAQFCGIIDQVKRHVHVADLSNWGDPLIHSDIYRMVRYAHDAGLWTYLSSNLHAFRPDAGDAEAMVASGLDMLNCSLHAVTQATYETYQPGKRLDAVLAKIESILAAKRRLRSCTPIVRLFFVVTKFNEAEIVEFRSLARSLDCEAVSIPASLNLRLTPRDEWPTIMARWLPSDDQWIAPWYRPAGHSPDRNGKKIYPCDWPWRGMVINWNGSVCVCCGDYDPNGEMGNIFHEPLHAIWNNEKYQAARGSFLSPSAPASCETPCRSCSGVMI